MYMPNDIGGGRGVGIWHSYQVNNNKIDNIFGKIDVIYSTPQQLGTTNDNFRPIVTTFTVKVDIASANRILGNFLCFNR